MASTYYNSSGKEVADGEIAYASDLNDINTSVDTAFQQVELAIDTISTNQSYYSDLAESWASEAEDVEVTTGKYSALHWAAKAEDDATQTAADRVQTGLDKVATAADRVQTGQDKVATAADRVQTGLDKVATAADRVQTGLDRTAAAGSASDASDSADAAAASAALFPTLGASDQGKFLRVATPYTNGLEAAVVDLSAYAPLNSPTLTGTPAAPTAVAGTNTTQVATTAFVTAAVTASVHEPYDVMHIQDRKTSGTAGGSSSAATTHIRTLNTKVTDEITGSGLSSNRITLPAGTYEINIMCPVAGAVGANKARLYNYSESNYILEGSSGSGANGYALLQGVFTIAAEKVFEVRHYITSAVATFGLGAAVSQGDEVYTDVFIKRRKW